MQGKHASVHGLTPRAFAQHQEGDGFETLPKLRHSLSFLK